MFIGSGWKFARKDFAENFSLNPMNGANANDAVSMETESSVSGRFLYVALVTAR